MPPETVRPYAKAVKWRVPKAVRRFGYFLFLLACLPFCFEVALRILGHQPYHQQPFYITSEPRGCLLPHARYGFALQPGSFRVGINNKVWYNTTHGADSFRVSSNHPMDTARQVWLLGCSFTYGMGIDDSATAAWQLQMHLPGVWIRNMGVPGHGTVHAWLRIREQIARGNTPGVAVIMFSAFHLERNVLSPVFRHSLAEGFGNAAPEMAKFMSDVSMPFVDSDTLAYEPWKNLYHDWPGREKLTMVQYLQSLYDDHCTSTLDARNVTLKLFDEISQFCQLNAVPLLVAGISDDPATNSILGQLRRSGIRVVHTRVDLKDPAMTHAPYDSHPSAQAHHIYAGRLLPVLKEMLP